MAKRASRTPMRPLTGFRSQIVGYGEQAAGQLLGNPANWRVHHGTQKKAMQALLGHELGWIQNVIVNKRTSEEWPAGQRHVETMLDGHMRVDIALREGDETPVPVTYVDLGPREEALALAVFDKVGALADTDDEKYDALLTGLANVSEDVSAILVRTPKKSASRTNACACCRKDCHPECRCYAGREG